MGQAVESAVVERMVAIRRDLHQNPELSWQEHRTADRISSTLHELGIPHRHLMGTGVARRAGASLAKGELDASERIETVTVDTG
jgi:metal-dependent amidase/aminoacylase/carboxypeptidase family protein